MKLKTRLTLWCAPFVVLVLCCSINVSLPAENKQRSNTNNSLSRSPKIVPSNILEDLQRKKEQRPNITSTELVTYANRLLKLKGLNYHFDACEVLTANGKSTERDLLPLESPETFFYKMTQTNGRDIKFQIVTADGGGGLCSECFFQIPALQVTKEEILVLADGRQYSLRRPQTFNLGEAELVDDSLQNVLRTWQLPFQTVPVGISPEGSKLYVEFYEGQAPDDLVLELSEDGKLQFRSRKGVDLKGEGEWIENYPKDPDNDYLSFMRFRARNRNYIVKFIAPCT